FVPPRFPPIRESVGKNVPNAWMNCRGGRIRVCVANNVLVCEKFCSAAASGQRMCIPGAAFEVKMKIRMSARSRRRARVRDGKGTAPPQAKERPRESTRVHSEELLHWARGALIVIAIIYAFLAGLRTVHDYDLGWQLANSRWAVQHGHISSVDVITYTAA